MDSRGWQTRGTPRVMPVECVSAYAEGIVHEVRLAASCRAPVLISASGPESARALAYEIHDRSARTIGPFRAFRARSFPIEPSALRLACRGLARLSHWGTLYIDRIEETPPEALGTVVDQLLGRSRLHDVRVICGTAVNLHEYVQRGIFDEADFYRLNVVHIDVLGTASYRLES